MEGKRGKIGHCDRVSAFTLTIPWRTLASTRWRRKTRWNPGFFNFTTRSMGPGDRKKLARYYILIQPVAGLISISRTRPDNYIAQVERVLEQIASLAPLEIIHRRNILLLISRPAVSSSFELRTIKTTASNFVYSSPTFSLDLLSSFITPPIFLSFLSRFYFPSLFFPFLSRPSLFSLVFSLNLQHLWYTRVELGEVDSVVHGKTDFTSSAKVPLLLFSSFPSFGNGACQPGESRNFQQKQLLIIQQFSSLTVPH